ncbi:hypothetical protein CC2G_008411 [Coprinopsis cinerea AmutBmut pab1-1]|nr:hypothetical protein CC2G_013997 [Coprinopsis cinerea AmutBmut pab1-1]KAG2015115.1 hypothetical protein CC2G_008411 [Coprinopsis cinerea AmutBmut pab1-1]
MRYPLIHSFLTAEDHSHKERRIKWHESLNPVAGDSLLPDLNDYSAFYTVNKSIRTKLDTILGRESNKNDDRKENLPATQKEIALRTLLDPMTFLWGLYGTVNTIVARTMLCSLF